MVFYPMASATAYGWRPKFVMAEHSATAEGENCAYVPTLVAVIIYYWFIKPQSLVLCMYDTPVLGLQRTPENVVLAPSVLVLYE